MTFGDPPPDNQADIELEADRLLGLLRHFRIPCNDSDPWFALAAALARKHYPKGAPNPIGRPRLGSIAKLYGLVRKRGRPRKYPRKGPVRPRGRPPRDQAACLFNSVWFYKEDQKEDQSKEHPGATDKEAITAVLRESVQRLKERERLYGRSEQPVLIPSLRSLQNALSRYRTRLRRLHHNSS